MPNSSIKIGIVDQSSTGWAAGATYTRMTIRSLGAACQVSGDHLYFLSQNGEQRTMDHSGVQVVELDAVDYLPAEKTFRQWFGLSEKSIPLRGESYVRNLLRLKNNSNVFSAAGELGIKVLLPLLDVPRQSVLPKTIGWIPDFQHLHLPDFFSPGEIVKRNATIQRLLDKARLILLSSRAAERDFIAHAPAQASKARVASFPSLLAFTPLSGEPESTLLKFKLPPKFALVANQFWAHKNHAVVISALGRLRAQGMKIPVVMTGLPVDDRDAGNKNFSFLLQAIASSDLREQIIILGHVNYSDLVNLMRIAAVVIQPSRFEGWSTIVEDAKALGRPLVCSDLEVHHEQAPESLGFFPCDAPEILADLLAAHWQSLEPGPAEATEAAALATERNFARRHGELLLGICKEAAAV